MHLSLPANDESGRDLAPQRAARETAIYNGSSIIFAKHEPMKQPKRLPNPSPAALAVLPRPAEQFAWNDEQVPCPTERRYFRRDGCGIL
jgi:hypothetical protein